jgi:hypothetical protein
MLLFIFFSGEHGRSQPQACDCIVQSLIRPIDATTRPAKRTCSIRIVNRFVFPNAIRNPHLDDGLTRNPKPLGLFVKRLNHPLREIDIDAPLNSPGTSRLGEVKMFDNAFTVVERFVKSLSFHNSLRLHEVNSVFDSVALAFLGIELKLHAAHYIPLWYKIAIE